MVPRIACIYSMPAPTTKGRGSRARPGPETGGQAPQLCPWFPLPRERRRTVRPYAKFFGPQLSTRSPSSSNRFVTGGLETIGWKLDDRILRISTPGGGRELGGRKVAKWRTYFTTGTLPRAARRDRWRQHRPDLSRSAVQFQANYNLLFKTPTGHASDAQIAAFEDTWHWGEQAEREFTEVLRPRSRRPN